METAKTAITRESLEKNGFTARKESRYDIYAFSYGKATVEVRLYRQEQEGQPTTLVKVTAPSRSCERKNNMYNYDVKTMEDLQQAIRLFGINKTLIWQ